MRNPGRKAIDDRLVLNGILHMLHAGIALEDLPGEYGPGIQGEVLAAAAYLAEGGSVGRATSEAAREVEGRGECQLVSGKQSRLFNGPWSNPAWSTPHRRMRDPLVEPGLTVPRRMLRLGGMVEASRGSSVLLVACTTR